MTGQDFKRKLTAIFSADVVGYSRLMGDDEEATIRTLTTYRDLMTALIHQHAGRVIDAPGDNLLAAFASVVDAVSCAVAVQKEMQIQNETLPDKRRMRFRIGVNLGDIIQEKTRIYGDGVNIAARLESLCDGGGICISGTTFEHVETKLDLQFRDLGEHEVKNIVKPLRVYRVQTSDERLETPVDVDLRLPDKPSIAVLPFDNMSGDPQQAYFSNGISEQIITGLSRIRDLFVIARHSSFAYKEAAVKVQQVGRELGVRYVLEGSVQTAGKRVRVTAQLIDAQTGHHLWADHYDRELIDIFGIQDDITIKVVDALNLKLIEGEQWRQWEGQTQNIKAFLLTLQGFEYFYRLTREDNFQARKFFEEAITFDAEYIIPQAGLGWSHLTDIFIGWSEAPIESLEKAEKLARKTLVRDHAFDLAHSLMSQIYLLKRQHDKAIEAAKQATIINPNGANAFSWLGFALVFSGKSEDALPILHKAIRLNPFPPAYYYLFLGLAYRVSGQYEEALQVYAMALDGVPNAVLVLLGMTACYINLNRPSEAAETVKRVLEAEPNFSLEWYKTTMPFRNKLDLDRFIESLRRAGLPG